MRNRSRSRFLTVGWNYFGGGIENQCEKAVEMLKTIRMGFFSTDIMKGRGYISSKYIVTG